MAVTPEVLLVVSVEVVPAWVPRLVSVGRVTLTSEGSSMTDCCVKRVGLMNDVVVVRAALAVNGVRVEMTMPVKTEMRLKMAEKDICEMFFDVLIVGKEVI